MATVEKKLYDLKSSEHWTNEHYNQANSSAEHEFQEIEIWLNKTFSYTLQKLSS